MISYSANVLERIYDSALNGTFFDAVLDTLHGFLPNAAVLLVGQDTQHPSGNFLLHRGLETDAISHCMANLAIDDPWLEQLWQKKEGVVYEDDELISQQSIPALKSTKPRASAVASRTDCAVGIVINRKNTRQVVLEIRFPESERAVMKRDIATLLEELGPHLVRAARIMHLNYYQPLDAQLISDMLEMFPFPMLIIDTEFRVRYINERAGVLADNMDIFFISADGKFHAVDLDAEIELQRNIVDLNNGHRPDHPLLRLPNADNSKQLFLSLKKLGKPKLKQLGPNSIYQKQSARFALVLQDTQGPLKLRHHALWSAFKLTNAESDLVSLLLEGYSVAECAFRQNLAKQTLRNQLGSIMKKTQTNRQPQLIALLTRLALSTIQ